MYLWEMLRFIWDTLKKKLYPKKNGKEKSMKDFAEVQTDFFPAVQAFRSIWQKFFKHHEQAKWQTQDCNHCKDHLKIDELMTVIDFA